MTDERRWTLEAARLLLPEVRERTAKAAEAVEGLLAEREALSPGSDDRAVLDARIQDVVSSWARGMEALGLRVKGAWLVDFDNGSGCYCWKWPEERLEWFHGYEEGFAGRIRIQ
jgi:hypothetical protein